MAAVFLACRPQPAGSPSPDGGSARPADAGVFTTDASTSDASVSDASMLDASRDAGPADASLPDAATADASAPDASGRDAGAATDAAGTTWRSTLYPAGWTWTPGGDGGPALQDYSYAGYRHGEEPPVVEGPVFDAVMLGADPTGMVDSTEVLQAAMEAASAAGGVAFIPAGRFRVDGALNIQASHVVLRGESPDVTTLVFTRVGPSFSSHITVGSTPTHGEERMLAEDGSVGSTCVTVADATGLAAGDDVALGHVITPEWVEEHGMTGTWTAFNGTWQPLLRRTVVAVDTTSTPHAVVVDVPLRVPLRVRDGASLKRETGLLRQVGVENLSVTNAVDRAAAWGVDQVHVLAMTGVADSWVRNVHSVASRGSDHLQVSGILVAHARRVTVADCSMGRAQNRGSGGNGYLFELRQSSEVLTRDSTAQEGRHNFIQNWGFGVTGCVWLRCTSRGSRSLLGSWDPVGLPAVSEFHHSLATANLIDSCTLDDGWNAGNRGTESTGAGHTATENVFWNTRGTGTVRSLQHGNGYVVGTAPGITVVTSLSHLSAGFSGRGTAPEDLLEGAGNGTTLEPQGLYDDQRTRRLQP